MGSADELKTAVDNWINTGYTMRSADELKTAVNNWINTGLVAAE